MSIKKATYGLVFFATPHRGGEFAQLGKIAAGIVRAIYSNPKNSFMDALEKDNLYADTIIEDFRNLLDDYIVYTFVESRPLPNLGAIVS
jgi:hypothetical protein